MNYFVRLGLSTAPLIVERRNLGVGA
jgi:hypothetical protein